jgi:hypothetical protein
VPGLTHTSDITSTHSVALSLSLKAQEYLESLKKSSIVVIQILMLYLLINNLCPNSNSQKQTDFLMKV